METGTGCCIPALCGSHLQPPDRGSQVGVWLCSQGAGDRMRGNSLNLCRGRFRLGIRENFFIERLVGHWKGPPREGGGVTIPGSVQKTCGFDT